MKLSLLFCTLMLCVGSFAASITDTRGMASTVAPISVHTPVPDASNSLVNDLTMAGAEGVPSSNRIMSGSVNAASVPESAGAAIVALFGYILMLRRRAA